MRSVIVSRLKTALSVYIFLLAIIAEIRVALNILNNIILVRISKKMISKFERNPFISAHAPKTMRFFIDSIYGKKATSS